jgi:hypothetical protein
MRSRRRSSRTGSRPAGRRPGRRQPHSCARGLSGCAQALAAPGRLLTRDVLDASLGPGRELPIFPDSWDEGRVAYAVEVLGVAVTCIVTIRFRHGAAAFIDLRTEDAS